MKTTFRIAATLAVASSALAQQQYQFTQLTGQGGVGLVDVFDINDQGVVVGSTATPNGIRPAIWSAAGGLQVVPGFSEAAVGTTINNAGQVGGSFLTGGAFTDARDAFLADNGVVTTFAPLGNDESAAGVGLTDGGRLLVSSGFFGGDFNDTLIAEAFLTLGTTNGDLFPSVNPQGVSANGNIVGTNDVVIGRQIFDLPPLPGTSRVAAQSINDAGIAVGSVSVPMGGFGSDVFPAIWDANQSAMLLPVPNVDLNSRAFDINNQNQVVGRSDNDAFLLPLGQNVISLQPLTMGVPQGLRLREANRINENGLILGTFDDGGFGGEGRFLLEPIGGNDDVGMAFCVSTVNSTGSAAVLSGSGSASISANSLTLRSDNVPNSSGLFFFGPNQIQVPFGDGFRCVGGMTQRINPPVFGMGNAATRMIDVQALGFSAGQTTNIQHFFRDTQAGGAGFNTSTGLEISFLP